MLQAASNGLFNPLSSKALNIVNVKIYNFLYQLSQQSQLEN